MWLRNYPTKRKLLKDIENLRAERISKALLEIQPIDKKEKSRIA